MDSAEDLEQERIWSALRRQVLVGLQPFGSEDQLGDADYFVVDDNYGWMRITVEIHRLHMLNPKVVVALKRLVSPFPGWEVVIAVDIPGTEGKWPPMGIIIRPHETVDGLRREYLPPEWQNVSYPDARFGMS